MNINKRKLAIQIFSVLGFILTIELAVIYYTANYDKYALSSFCSINEFIDCDGAARTDVSQFLGIPLAYWGMFFYLTVLFLTFVDKLKNIKFLKFLEVFKNPMVYITVIGTVAFACSMILAGISIWGINKLCILCVITYFIDFLIALISSENWKEYFISFKTTVLDFIDGAKNYPKTFVILLITAISFLTYSGVTNNFVPHIKKSKEIKKIMNMKTNPYKVDGNTLGAENADVVIELYSDYVCPMCYINNIMLHKAAKEFSNILVVHYNLPFDKECNTEISMSLHPGACYMARAALAAKKQGNYWGMSNLLYEKHPMNNEQLEPLIEKLNFDKQKFLDDMYSDTTTFELQNDLNKSYYLNIDGTPTMFINGERKVGIMSYDDMKDLLIKHGAKRR